MALFIDSGTPALYKNFIRKRKMKVIVGSVLKDRKDDDFSFLQRREYKKYLHQYISFLKKNEHLLEIYVNLDIINNAEETYKNQKYLEKHRLHPLPVFHFGNDPKWLKRYIDEGYDYIAIGGIVPNPFQQVQPELDRIWESIICDKNGFPKVKIHGFAITSPRYIQRYPWYSVDSTSWVKMGRCGIFLVPPFKNGKPDYSRSPYNLFVTVRSPYKSKKGKHIDNISKDERKKVLQYLDSLGIPFGKSKVVKKKPNYKPTSKEYILEKTDKYCLVEQIIEQGVCNNNIMRDIANLKYYINVCNSVPKWPWSIKFKTKGLF